MLGIDPRRSARPHGGVARASSSSCCDPTSRSRITAEWFTLENARLHLRPYTQPYPEVAVAAMISPSGPRAAGKYGVLAAVDRRDATSGHRLARPSLAGVRGARRPSSATRPTARTGGSSARSTWPRRRSRPTRTSSSASTTTSTTSARWPRCRSCPKGPPNDLADQMNNTGAGVIGTPDDADPADRRAHRAERRRFRHAARPGARVGQP